MRGTFWDKRIPTLLGIVLIVIGIGITSFLVNRGVLLITQASPTETPLQVRISNISDTSFTVSYTTKESVLGIISYGDTKELTQTAFDDKQQLGETKPYKTHYITVRNLKPSTTYYFAIISGKSTFLNDSVPFEVITASTIPSPPTKQQPISGKVILPNGEAPTEAIVYVTGPGTQTIAKMVKSDGTYVIPLNSIRTINLSSYVEFAKDSSIQMLFVQDDMESTVTISPKLEKSVGIITLSKNYDFTSTIPIGTESASTVPNNTGSFPSFSAKEVIGKDPAILTPKKDERFADQQPLFRGTATSGESVTITIHSQDGIQIEVKADNKGVWMYRPPSALSPGQHTISIVSKGSSGVLKTVTQSFTVYAQGSQVDQTATPSATPTGIATPTIPPTPTPTLAAPSPTPTPLPTAQPPAASKGGVQEIASPGSPSVISVGLMALGTTLVGIALFLLTRGNVPL